MLERVPASGRKETHTQKERECLRSPEVSISLAVKEQSSLEALSCLSAPRLLDTSHSLHLDVLPELLGSLARAVRTLQLNSETNWPNLTHFQLFSTVSSFSPPCLTDQNQKAVLETALSIFWRLQNYGATIKLLHVCSDFSFYKNSKKVRQWI